MKLNSLEKRRLLLNKFVLLLRRLQRRQKSRKLRMISLLLKRLRNLPRQKLRFSLLKLREKQPKLPIIKLKKKNRRFKLRRMH
jgi:hypothetical protein